MKNKMQILGRISLGLLICIILGQGIWLYRVREMENHGFEQTVGRGLNDILWVEVIFLIGFIVCLVWQRVVATKDTGTDDGEDTFGRDTFNGVDGSDRR